MPASRIPERNPVGDPFTGIIGLFQQKHFLAKTLPDHVQSIVQGNFIIRYGIRYLGKPHFSIVPGLVALDYGAMLTGEDAFDFLLNKSNLHPRADVIGYRNDGLDEMMVVKSLDLALPVDVLVYENDQSTRPIASVDAFIGASTDLPERTLHYLPHYPTLDLWEADHLND